MQATANEGLSLSNVLGDLNTIVGAVRDQDAGDGASYDTVQKGLPNLNLHILTYIRFLENHGYVEYDRVGDLIRVSDEGLAAEADDSVWRDKAETAFSQHITRESDPLGDLDLEVDSILDDIGSYAEAPSIESDDSPTGPEISTPEIDNTNQNPSPTGAAMNQPESYRDRRYSTGSNPAAPRTAGAAKSEYDREEEIGSGGMGTVYKAKQVKLDRLVAVKEIKEIFDVFAGVQRSDIVQRFTEIVQTQSRLTHPNIIQIIDIDTEARFPFVVMQYAPNGNLRRLIEVEGRPPLQIALKYFLQILHALSTAHDQDVTHGGIKPENVVLDSAGNALLTDFGISQVVELDGVRANQVYVGVGTVAYMSPEQFRDPNASSVKSDIYSLGIMFYEMLTGKVPGRRSPMPSSFYPDIPRKLDDIFDRMSMDDENDRYDSIDEILADFYGAKDVMKILDKRGGFVFLRDPMAHGETGLRVEIRDDAGEFGLGEESSSLGEDSSDVEDLEESSDAEAESEGEDGDVLDKLDKYGKLFDDEGESDDDDDEDSDDDSSDDD